MEVVKDIEAIRSDNYYFSDSEDMSAWSLSTDCSHFFIVNIYVLYYIKPLYE